MRSGHTDAPWTPAYVCCTLDESCFQKVEGGMNNQMELNQSKPFRATYLPPIHFQNMFCAKEQCENEQEITMDGPVCLKCKKTNRTKSYCRNKHKHNTLPWNTSFVALTVKDCGECKVPVQLPSRQSTTFISKVSEEGVDIEWLELNRASIVDRRKSSQTLTSQRNKRSLNNEYNQQYQPVQSLSLACESSLPQMTSLSTKKVTPQSVLEESGGHQQQVIVTSTNTKRIKGSPSPTLHQEEHIVVEKRAVFTPNTFEHDDDDSDDWDPIPLDQVKEALRRKSEYLSPQQESD